MKHYAAACLIVALALAGLRCSEQGYANERRADYKEMVLIPAGTFIMGKADSRLDAAPHRVEVSAFYMDIYEVTNAEYKKFIDATGHPAPFLDPVKYPLAEKYNWHNNLFPAGSDSLPVVLVSWHDAQAYARWCGKKLPTEAQWEMAARSLSDLEYPWGDQWDSTRVNTRQNGRLAAAAVGAFSTGATSQGIHDMIGNVWEWCADWYGKDYYTGSTLKDPQGPAAGATRVVRGGSWDTFKPERLKAYSRESFPPSSRRHDLGFRCVLEKLD